jgi:hypothetical protein
MPSYIEPDERLLTPEHWGADINNPDQFETSREIELAYLTPQEQHGAAIALSDCLNDVMNNGVAETDSDEEEAFDPSASEMPDGTIIILDSETLSAYNLQPGHMDNWDTPEITEESNGNGDGLVDLWRRNQPGPPKPEDVRFGAERAVFVDEKMIYNHSLQWGVLATRRDGSGQRVAATWNLGGPRTTGGGVIVPVDTTTPEGWGREAAPLPIELGRTVTRPAIRSFHFAIRTIARTNAVYVVRVAEGEE